MTFTLEVGPLLAQVLRYSLYLGVPAYLINQWWIVGSVNRIAGRTGRP